jgi:ArsR family transcriptional regulator
MSRHMQVLKQAGLVVDRRDAQWVRYRIKPDLSPTLVRLIEVALEIPIAAPEGAA